MAAPESPMTVKLVLPIPTPTGQYPTYRHTVGKYVQEEVVYTFFYDGTEDFNGDQQFDGVLN